MDEKNLVKEFLNRKLLGVIATVDENGKPEAALINYALTDNYELIFETLKSTRKYKNLMVNNTIAFVVGDSEEIEVQYEGEAREISEAEGNFKQVYFLKNPDAKRWEETDGKAFFVVSPVWIRYLNYTREPRQILEFSTKQVIGEQN